MFILKGVNQHLNFEEKNMEDSLLAGSSSSIAEQCYEGWEHNGGFLVYIVIISYAFYLFSIICDDYFVPALNIMCVKLNLSDDFAGATLMAAGASSPELFSAIVGQFITKTPTGTGTVVGSEIFNMLCIVGAAALATSGDLKLDWRLLFRDVLFYVIAIVLLLVFLMDSIITWWESLIFVLVYALYAAFCYYYWDILGFFGLKRMKDPLMKPMEKGREIQPPDEVLSLSLNLPTDSHSGEFLGLPYKQVLMHSYLQKKSRFYTKIRVNSEAWQTRWCILDNHQFTYCRDPCHPTLV